MPDRRTVETFVAMVETCDFVGALERYYADDAWSQDNQAEPKRGRDILIAGEKRIMSYFDAMKTERLAPILIEGDTVAIRWRFTFTKDGVAKVIDEMALQTWNGDRIVEEHFFYDPAQMR